MLRYIRSYIARTRKRHKAAEPSPSPRGFCVICVAKSRSFVLQTWQGSADSSGWCANGEVRCSARRIPMAAIFIAEMGVVRLRLLDRDEQEWVIRVPMEVLHACLRHVSAQRVLALRAEPSDERARLTYLTQVREFSQDPESLEPTFSLRSDGCGLQFPHWPSLWPQTEKRVYELAPRPAGRGSSESTSRYIRANIALNSR
jgi:hypothetical protein